jgi:uncharacterized protein YegJ (DUF2314 family)
MKRTVLVGLVLAVSLGGCDDRSDDSSDDPVIEVEADDKEMNAAIAHARSTVGEFVKRLANPGPADDGFSVKKMIEDGQEVEHFWLTGVSYSEGEFTGKIGNDPQSVGNVKFGQKVSVAETEITDWMYLDDGKMIGNFTLRVLFGRMPKEEAEALRKQFKMDE